MAEAKNESKSEENWFAKHRVLSVIGALLIIGIIGSALNGDDQKVATSESTTSNASETSEKSNESEPMPVEKGLKGGMYKVGTDMPAGEYVVVGSGYLEISSDSTGKFESIVTNDNYSNRTIVMVADGQYIKFSGRAYTWEEAPKVDTSKGTLPDGRYKVGVDFPAGEYKVTPNGSGYLAVTSSASDSLESIVTNDNFDSEQYVTLQDGQYLKLNRATLKLK